MQLLMLMHDVLVHSKVLVFQQVWHMSPDLCKATERARIFTLPFLKCGEHRSVFLGTSKGLTISPRNLVMLELKLSHVNP